MRPVCNRRWSVRFRPTSFEMLVASSFKLRALSAALVATAALATVVPLPSVFVHHHEHGEQFHVHAATSRPTGVGRSTQAKAHAGHHHHGATGHTHSNADAHGSHDDSTEGLERAQLALQEHQHFQAPFLSSLLGERLLEAKLTYLQLLPSPAALALLEGLGQQPRSRGPPATVSV